MLMMLISSPQCEVSNALSTSRQNTADAIADICIEEWDIYGILPSVAIGQAFVESGLGSGGSNLFGVNGCSGLGPVSATYRYLQCLHNGFFKGRAAWKDSPEEQMYYILERGYYCAGEYPHGRYYYNVLGSIDRYGWRRYDRTLEKRLREREKKKKRKKRQKGYFRIIFSYEIPEGTCIVDPGYIKKGSTIIYSGGIIEATKTNISLKNTIIIGRSSRTLLPVFGSEKQQNLYLYVERILQRMSRTKLEVIENAKG